MVDVLEQQARIKLPPWLVLRAGSSQDRFALLMENPHYIGERYLSLTVDSGQGLMPETVPAH